MAKALSGAEAMAGGTGSVSGRDGGGALRKYSCLSACERALVMERSQGSYTLHSTLDTGLIYTTLNSRHRAHIHYTQL